MTRPLLSFDNETYRPDWPVYRSVYLYLSDALAGYYGCPEITACIRLVTALAAGRLAAMPDTAGTFLAPLFRGGTGTFPETGIVGDLDGPGGNFVLSGNVGASTVLTSGTTYTVVSDLIISAGDTLTPTSC